MSREESGNIQIRYGESAKWLCACRRAIVDMPDDRCWHCETGTQHQPVSLPYDKPPKVNWGKGETSLRNKR